MICIGICTVSSRKVNYLPQTLDSLIQNVSDIKNIKIRVYNCDPKNTEVDPLEGKTYPNVEVVRVDNHPIFENLPNNFGDSPERVKWRTKQCFDFSEAFFRSLNQAPFYLHIEDDVIAGKNYDQLILQELKNHPNWGVMHLAAGGMIGWLFHNKDLFKLNLLYKAFMEEMPADWLIRYFVQIQLHVGRQFVHTPFSLFQHIGEERSLEGNVQVVKFPNFVGDKCG